MNIRPGRYLVEVEHGKVKRARAGHAFVEWRLLVVRNLFTDAAYYPPHIGIAPGVTAEAIMSSRNANFMNNMSEAAHACGVKLEIPAPLRADAEKFAQHTWDEAVRISLDVFRGKVAVVQASEVASQGRWHQEPFVRTDWSAPTPADLCSDMTRSEALAMIGRLYRMLKDGGNTRAQDRIDEALRFLETLEVPR